MGGERPHAGGGVDADQHPRERAMPVEHGEAERRAHPPQISPPRTSITTSSSATPVSSPCTTPGTAKYGDDSPSSPAPSVDVGIGGLELGDARADAHALGRGEPCRLGVDLPDESVLVAEEVTPTRSEPRRVAELQRERSPVHPPVLGARARRDGERIDPAGVVRRRAEHAPRTAAIAASGSSPNRATPMPSAPSTRLVRRRQVRWSSSVARSSAVARGGVTASAHWWSARVTSPARGRRGRRRSDGCDRPSGGRRRCRRRRRPDTVVAGESRRSAASRRRRGSRCTPPSRMATRASTAESTGVHAVPL